jgi:LytTr DNA-binding domain
MAMSKLCQVGIVYDHFLEHSNSEVIVAFSAERRATAHKVGRGRVSCHRPQRIRGLGPVMSLSPEVDFPRIASDGAAAFIETLPGLPVVAARTSSPRIAIKVKGRILFINLGDVVAIQAEGNYVSLLRSASSFLLRESISMVAGKVEPYGFIRIHRSALVNTAFVEEIRPYPTGEYGLRVKGGKEYTVTRTYKKNLQALAEFWIGTSSLFPARTR